MNTRVRMVLTVLACGVLAAACSGARGHKSLAPTTTTPAERVEAAKTAPFDEFCGRLDDLTTATAEVGVVTDLTHVRQRLAAATKLADQATTAGTPKGSNTYVKLLALDADLRVVNNWVQTQATQADLDHNRQPSNVQLHFTDMGVQFRALQAWSDDNCKAFTGGDND